jgi:hypothetical protein
MPPAAIVPRTGSPGMPPVAIAARAATWEAPAMHPALTIGLVLHVAAVAAGAALIGVAEAPATVALLAGISAVPALGSAMCAWALVRTEGAAAIAAIGAFGFAPVVFAIGGLALLSGSPPGMAILAGMVCSWIGWVALPWARPDRPVGAAVLGAGATLLLAIPPHAVLALTEDAQPLRAVALELAGLAAIVGALVVAGLHRHVAPPAARDQDQHLLGLAGVAETGALGLAMAPAVIEGTSGRPLAGALSAGLLLALAWRARRTARRRAEATQLAPATLLRP